MKNQVIFNEELLERFIEAVKAKYPKKAFGYFLSPEEGGEPTDFIMFKEDVRNEWKEEFEEYGQYYVRNEDAGFLATEEEMYEVTKKIQSMNMKIVGVYHSHQRHPAIFSTVDVDLHPSEKVWHLIISLRNVNMPQIKIFSVNNGQVSELRLIKESKVDAND